MQFQQFSIYQQQCNNLHDQHMPFWNTAMYEKNAVLTTVCMHRWDWVQINYYRCRIVCGNNSSKFTVGNRWGTAKTECYKKCTTIHMYNLQLAINLTSLWTTGAIFSLIFHSEKLSLLEPLLVWPLTWDQFSLADPRHSSRKHRPKLHRGMQTSPQQ